MNVRDAWRYLISSIDAPVSLSYICKLNEYVARNEALEWVFCVQGMLVYPERTMFRLSPLARKWSNIEKKFLKHHDLPDIRLHDVRHTHATMLIHADLNVRAVAARMGHANPSVTLTVYSHALQSAGREAALFISSVAK